MMFRAATLALLMFWCTGCAADSGSDKTGATLPAPPIQPAVAVVPAAAAVELCASDADYAAERFATRFVLGAFDDLLVRVRLSDPVPVGKTLALQIRGPRGALMSTYRRPIDAGELQIIVPIEGTEIGKRRLYGAYRFSALVEQGVEQGGAELGAATIQLAEAP